VIGWMPITRLVHYACRIGILFGILYFGTFIITLYCNNMHKPTYVSDSSDVFSYIV